MAKGTTQQCVTPLEWRRVSVKVNVSEQMFIKFSILLIFKQGTMLWRADTPIYFRAV